MVGTGMALMAGLIKGALDKGVEFRRNARGRRLVIDDGAIVGIEVEQDGRMVRIGARRAVILASGGFEWNKDMVTDMMGDHILMYGSDYLLGLSTFAPEAFAARDRLWAVGDPAFQS